jgi:nucleotide-binding universal stress UspA family protein
VGSASSQSTARLPAGRRPGRIGVIAPAGRAGRRVLHSRRREGERIIARADIQPVEDNAMAKPRGFAVLIATDGSEAGTSAVNAITTFPWPAGIRVHGVVVRSPVATSELPEFVWADVERSVATVAEDARKILARRWPDAQVRVVDGPTVDAILEQADRGSARVIVLGSRGHGPIARLLLGSTSLGVVRRTKHAALIVRGRSRGFTRVALGFDGSSAARHAVTFLAGLEVPADGHVTIIRVLERVRLPSLSRLPEATRTAVVAQLAAADAAEEKKARREMDTAAAELRRAGWKVDVALRKGAPLHELLTGTKRARSQLLAVGAHGHTALERLLLGSVAEGALHRSPVSVLVTR